jgi:ribosomal peptide maturation radical SAM protein 1
MSGPTRDVSDRRRVVLVNMPFASFRHPSLGLGLLKAALSDLPVEVRVLDACLDFAALISAPAYDAIAAWRSEDLLADWVFSAALRAEEEVDASRADERVDGSDYLLDVLAGGLAEHRVDFFGKPPLTGELRAQIAAAREAASDLLTACLDEIVALDPLLVGFTSMVHQQVAALALARRVKAALPDACIAFGGASCRGEMGLELLRSFPYVDAVAGGDGETVLPALVGRLLAGGSPHDLGDLLARGDEEARTHDASPSDDAGRRLERAASDAAVADLDSLPIPDFGDYFARLSGSPLRDDIEARVPFEASRGCWWGERSRCIFCGQASAALTYRQKSASRMLTELEELTQRHPGHPFLFTDEIVPLRFIDEVAPLLPDRLPDFRALYFEARPGLSRQQLTVLAHAGIRRLEVGIESLSTPVLKLMRKGTTAAEGVQLLKWARELGTGIVWNLIWGFPGEDPRAAETMAAIVPLLTHLQPPHTAGPVRLDRFSPLFEEAHEWGIDDVAPYPAYRYVYELRPEALRRLAYHFTFRVFDRGPGAGAATASGAEPQSDADRHGTAGGERPAPAGGERPAPAALAEQVDRWQHAYPQALLWSADDGQRLVLSDSRPGFDAEQLTVLDGEHRLLYLACATIQTTGTLANELTHDTGRHVDTAEVQELLRPLLDQGFMLRDGERYLSLALPVPGR